MCNLNYWNWVIRMCVKNNYDIWRIYRCIDRKKRNDRTNNSYRNCSKLQNQSANQSGFVFVSGRFERIWDLIGRDNSKINFINADILEAHVWVAHTGFDLESSIRAHIYRSNHITKPVADFMTTEIYFVALDQIIW